MAYKIYIFMQKSRKSLLFYVCVSTSAEGYLLCSSKLIIKPLWSVACLQNGKQKIKDSGTWVLSTQAKQRLKQELRSHACPVPRGILLSPLTAPSCLVS